MRSVVDMGILQSRQMTKASEVEWLSETTNDLRLRVHAVTGSSRTKVAGTHGGRLKVKLKAPPADGAANEELIQFLAKALRVPKKAVEIVTGRAGRRKVVRVSGGAKVVERARKLVC